MVSIHQFVMRKTYWGYLFLGLVIVGILGSLDEQKTKSEWTNFWTGTIVLSVPGVLLTKSGRKTDNHVKRFVDVFFTMKSNNEVLSCLEIQKRAGLSAADVYKSKSIAEQRGILPYGSELV